jgi:hypothetical protein
MGGICSMHAEDEFIKYFSGKCEETKVKEYDVNLWTVLNCLPGSDMA